MAPPPIITNEFLLTCLHYEFLKNKESPREAHRNLCQMMLSMDIRREVTHVEVVDIVDSPSRNVPVVSGEPEVITVSSDSDSDPDGVTILSSDDEKPSTSDYRRAGAPDPRKRKPQEVLDPDPNEPSTSDSRRPRESDSPEPKRMKTEESQQVITLDDDSDPINIEESPLKSILKQKTPEKSDQQAKRKVAFQFSRDKSSSTDEDSDGETPTIQKLASLSLLTKNEKDVRIDIISLAWIESFFKNFREFETVAREQKLSVADLKGIAHSFVIGKLQKVKNSPKGSEHPYTSLKSTVDFHKVKITLRNQSVTAQLEYWHQENGGSWMWHNDDVGFIPDLDYETLAANEFTDCLAKSCPILESLEFDIEENPKWTPKEEHSAAFWYKVKRCVRLSRFRIGAKKFTMKVLRCRRKIDSPFKLRLVTERGIEEIKLRVWDDSYLRKPPQIGYLELLEDDWQWDNAKMLDIEDPNLDFWAPDISTFNRVKRWIIRSTDELFLREFFKQNGSWTKCEVTAKEPIDLNGFPTPEYSEVINGRVSTQDKNRNKEVFNVTIEKFGITYEVIDQSRIS